MSFAEMLAPELDQEMATTRKLLARVPSDKGAWKRRHARQRCACTSAISFTIADS